MKSLVRTFAMAALVLLAVGSQELNAQGRTATQGAARELIVIAQNITARNETAAGKPRPDSVVAPGDVVEYRLVFTNTKDIALKNVVFQDPIPSGLSYVAGTAKSGRDDVTVEYSIDGGKSWSPRPMITVIEAGKKVTKPALPETYTNVRWKVTGSVNPGASVEAQFRTRVDAVSASKTK